MCSMQSEVFFMLSTCLLALLNGSQDLHVRYFGGTKVSESVCLLHLIKDDVVIPQVLLR